MPLVHNRPSIIAVYPEGTKIKTKAQKDDIRVVLVSDTHNADIPFEFFPEGDLLLHAGDHTIHGTPDELFRAGAWLKQLAARYPFGIVTVGGNHDLPLDAETWKQHTETEGKWTDQMLRACHESIHGDQVRLLHHEYIEIAGLRLFGSPFLPLTPRRVALPSTDSKKYTGYNREDSELRARFNEIPPCDILITHTPAAGILDESVQYGGVTRPKPLSIGSTVLIDFLRSFDPTHRPALHVFGHEHDSRGMHFDEELGIWFANAAAVDGDLGIIQKGGGYVIKPDFRAFVVDFRH